MMTMGKGCVYGASLQQLLNTKRYTKAKIVGVSDLLPQIVWTRHFLEARLYKIYDNIVYQKI